MPRWLRYRSPRHLPKYSLASLGVKPNFTRDIKSQTFRQFRYCTTSATSYHINRSKGFPSACPKLARNSLKNVQRFLQKLQISFHLRLSSKNVVLIAGNGRIYNVPPIAICRYCVSGFRPSIKIALKILPSPGRIMGIARKEKKAFHVNYPPQRDFP